MTRAKPRKGVVVELVDGRRLHWPDATDYGPSDCGPGSLDVLTGPAHDRTVLITIGPGRWVTATLVGSGCWPMELDGQADV